MSSVRFEYVAIVIEVLVVSAVIFAVIKRKRSGSKSDSSSGVLPEPLHRFVLAEFEIWRAVARFLFSRRDPEKFYPANHSILGYLVIFSIVTAPVELLLVHVLIPSETIAWVVTGVSVYGLFWVLGMYLSVRTTSHKFSNSELTLRCGVLGEVRVPYSLVAGVSVNAAKSSTAGDGLRTEIGDSGEIETWLMSAGQTDVTIELSSPVTPYGLLKRGQPSLVVNLTVNDPERFVHHVNAQISL